MTNISFFCHLQCRITRGITLNNKGEKWVLNKIVVLIFITILLTISACTSINHPTVQPDQDQITTSTPYPPNKISFPRQVIKNGEWAAMNALAHGTLILVDSCIRLQTEMSSVSYLLIWPPDFQLRFEEDIVGILNSDGKRVASLGDTVQMSGGEINLLSMLDMSIQEQVPPQCNGPYWIMGYEFSKSNPKP